MNSFSNQYQDGNNDKEMSIEEEEAEAKAEAISP
jgi:hypothetical protein